jgi:hypothetical protein
VFKIECLWIRPPKVAFTLFLFFKFGIYAFKNAYLATFLQIWMN